MLKTPEEANAWRQSLKNYDLDTIEKATIKYIQMKRYKPAPADIIDMIPCAPIMEKRRYVPKFETLPDGRTVPVVQCRRCMDTGLITWEDLTGCRWGRPCTCAAALDNYSAASAKTGGGSA